MLNMSVSAVLSQSLHTVHDEGQTGGARQSDKRHILKYITDKHSKGYEINANRLNVRSSMHLLEELQFSGPVHLSLHKV